MRTNNAYASRYRVTKKTKKVLGRKIGQNHFNAKEPRRKQLNQKRKLVPVVFSARNRRRFLPGT